MKKYKTDLLLDLFSDICLDLENVFDLSESEQLTKLIEKSAENLPRKQRLIFCSVIQCKNSQVKAFKMYCKLIEKIEMESFQRNMSRARKNIVKSIEKEPIVNQLRNEILDN